MSRKSRQLSTVDNGKIDIMSTVEMKRFNKFLTVVVSNEKINRSLSKVHAHARCMVS